MKAKTRFLIASLYSTAQRYVPMKKIAHMSKTLLLFLLVVMLLTVLSRAMQSKSIPQSESCQDCFSFSYKYRINEKQLCFQYGPFSPQVVILVSSRPSSFDSRKAVRETWSKSLSAYPGRVAMAFVIGEEPRWNTVIKKESSRHHDIIQGNFNYQSRTLETVFMLKWIAEFCSSTPVFLLTDDSIYINVPLFMKYIVYRQSHGWEPGNGLVRQCFGSEITRSQKSLPSSKGSQSTYCDNGIYMMSGELAKAMYISSSQVSFDDDEGTFISAVMQHLRLPVESESTLASFSASFDDDTINVLPPHFFCRCSMFVKNLPTRQFREVYRTQVELDCSTFSPTYSSYYPACFPLYVYKHFLFYTVLLVIITAVLTVFVRQFLFKHLRQLRVLSLRNVYYLFK